ncbi:hypothetical protein BJY24_000325 [Nocardia transvalensis]|uniref:Secreted protein n=1 Tax=Nocardia transvalensis TaxID=37333 RepID=A0A7W9P940_9NOCA|nr:hypothetical protein [Nocardia transvalensis]MBB5911458.1 hypothetical protein [Nocardia transvalensis]
MFTRTFDRPARLARRLAAPTLVAAAAVAVLGAGSGSAEPAAGNEVAAQGVTPVFDGLSTHCGEGYCAQYDKHGRYVCTVTVLPLGGGSAAAYNWLPNEICDLQVTIANALP